jgi:hypothetical protein
MTISMVIVKVTQSEENSCLDSIHKKSDPIFFTNTIAKLWHLKKELDLCLLQCDLSLLVPGSVSDGETC